MGRVIWAILFLAIGGMEAKALTASEALHFVKKSAAQFRKKDKITVVFVWASWCTACQEFLPILKAKHNLENPKLSYVGISVDKDRQAAEIAQKFKYKFFPELNWMGQETDLYKNMTLPVTLILDGNGNLDTIYEGGYSDKVDYFAKRLRVLAEDE